MNFPASISPASSLPTADIDAIEPCAEQYRSPSDELDLDDETVVERTTSWAQYYHSIKAHQLLGC
jgi:hypothetical protein